MKKIALLILVLCILIGAILMLPGVQKILAGKNVRTDNISRRSKDFIEDQKIESEKWRNADISKKGKVEPTTIDVDGCFTITIPFKIAFTRKDTTCDFQINTERPKAKIIAYLIPITIQTLDDDSGVRMRRADKDTYKEYSKIYNETRFIIFQKKTGAFERIAFAQFGQKMLVVNVEALTGDDLTTDFHAMLNSVQLIK